MAYTPPAPDAIVFDLEVYTPPASDDIAFELGGAGTIYWAAYPSAQSAPSAEQLISATVENGIHSNDPAPFDSGVFDGLTITGLTAGVSYRLAAVWSNGVNNSNVVVSEPFAFFAGSGDLSASASEVAGSGISVVGAAGSGSLDAQVAQVGGSGNVVLVASGSLVAGSAQVSGSGAVVYIAAGGLDAQPSAVSGVGVATDAIAGSGFLAPGVSQVSGAGVITLVGSGALAANDATVSGGGSFVGAIIGTGALQAAPSQISAIGRLGLTGAGSLVAQSSDITGFSEYPKPQYEFSVAAEKRIFPIQTELRIFTVRKPNGS